MSDSVNDRLPREQWIQSLRASIAPLTSFHVGTRLEECGTAFVIKVSSEVAYALTAAHVLQPGVLRDPISKRETRLAYLDPEPPIGFERPRDPNQQYKVHFALPDGGRLTLLVTHISTNPKLDVALLELRPDPGSSAPDNLGELLRPLVLSTAFKVGDYINVAGIEFARDTFSCEWIDENTEEVKFNFRQAVIEGNLVDPLSDSTRGRTSSLTYGFGFTTNIPFAHGMSGSPIFHFVDIKGTKDIMPVVCGLVSADWNGANDQANTVSHATSILNALDLRTVSRETVLNWVQVGDVRWSGIDPGELAIEIVPDDPSIHRIVRRPRTPE
jgi:hypothetical protein